MVNSILLIDFGSTYTKVTAVDLREERILGVASGKTTIETDIMDGLSEAMTKLVQMTGKLDFERVLGCSSAAGGLKMVAIGLVPELTAEAAKRSALGAGAKVLGVFSHELSEYELEQIVRLNPDILLLAGGTDGGNKQVILHNAKMLAELALDIPIVVAGNKSVSPEVVAILSKKIQSVYHTENVMPRLNDLNIEPAKQIIRQVFLERIVEAKGLNKANSFVNRLIMPTPAAVLRAMELLSTGTEQEAGIGDLVALDIGGATTDVYSICKGEPQGGNVSWRGLQEPFAKRTVEGDLGMRFSAQALLKAAGERKIASLLPDNQCGIHAEAAVREYVDKVSVDTEHIALGREEQVVEIALAKACAKLGFDRHAGIVEKFYSPFGEVYAQSGKDLTAVPHFIGTGGVIVNNKNPLEILKGGLFQEEEPMLLKPQKPDFYVDELYIMASMGLLAEEYPEIALRLIKKHLRKV